MIFQATVKGIAGTVMLLAVYFVLISFVSGWEFVKDQFALFWYFIIGLAIGFGIQVGLYSYLRSAVLTGIGSGKALAVSGTTSAAAMVSCCAHYLVNILPIVAAGGIISLIGQYQVEFFWVGLALNVAGIAYIAGKVITYKKHSLSS